MKQKDKIQLLNWFQDNAKQTVIPLGFFGNLTDSVFGIIIAMRNIVFSAEKQDTILVHKYMGIAAWHIVNFATLYNIKIAEITMDLDYSEIEETDLEIYLQMIKDDLSFVKEMTEEQRIEFIQRCWVATFPDMYLEDFIKIDRILKMTIEDNKIKYPDLFKTHNSSM